MKVLKFGGTSLGTPQRMKHVADLVLNGDPKWVVLSAVSGTTNALYAIVECIKNRDEEGALERHQHLLNHYDEYITGLYQTDESCQDVKSKVGQYFDSIKKHIGKVYSMPMEKDIVASGEMISTLLFYQLLKERGIDVHLLSALEFMNVDQFGEPDMQMISSNLSGIQKDLQGAKIVITQGFICLNQRGEIDNLKRGGSDFSASIIGACLGAEEIQIWTDIDGMHNNDPRVVDKTRPISKLTFDEAAELAYFGAKVLHPSTIFPARQYNTDVRIKNTMKPEAEGTVISQPKPDWAGGVKAVAAKDGITAIKIRSSRMLMAYGFLRKVFEVFETFETPIDMITTSEVAVSLTIDNQEHLLEIIASLEPFGEVEVDYDMSIICVVGNGVAEDKGMVSKIFNSLDGIQVRMISYGGSRNNISLLVKSSLKKQALEGLNRGLFGL